MNGGRGGRAFPAAIGITLLASLAAAVVTSPGLGFGYDSIVYMASAEAFVGRGRLEVPFGMQLRGDDGPWRAMRDSTTPLVHWPPGYPMTLAAARMAAGDVVRGAWLVNALAIGVAAGAAALLLARGFTPIAGVVAGALWVLTPAVIQVQFEVLSEPLFVAFVALAILCMVRFPAQPWSYGIAAAAALATRYLGIGLGIAAGAFAALQAGSWRVRAARTAWAIAPTVATILALSLVQGAGTGGRRLAYYPGIGAPLRQAAVTVAYLFVTPLAVRHRALAVAVGVLVTLVVLALLVARPWHGRAADLDIDRARWRIRLLQATGLALAALVVVLVASRAFSDPQLSFDGRILLPVVLLAELSVLTLAFWWGERHARHRRLAIGAAAGAALLLVAEDVVLANRLRAAPRGYPTVAAAHAAIVAELEPFRRDRRPLYADAPDLVWWYTRRSARLLPELHDPADARALGAATAGSGAVLVRFRSPLPGEPMRRASCRPPSRCAWVGVAEPERVVGVAPRESHR